MIAGGLHLLLPYVKIPGTPSVVNEYVFGLHSANMLTQAGREELMPEALALRIS
jgi:hypothetical protein